MADDLRDRVLALIQYMRSTYRTGVAADDVAALLAEVERVSAERDVWMRRATVAETDADRLAATLASAPEWWADAMDTGSLLDLHDEAVAVRRD